MLTPAVLALLLRSCAGNVAPQTQAAVVAAESAGDAWALSDNTTRRVYRPRSYESAVPLARSLIDRGDSVDVGIGQINSGNFPALGVTPELMLHPCANLRVSSAMLTQAYRSQYAALGGTPSVTQLALERMLQIYNSGKPWGDDRYAALVRGQLGTALVQRATIYQYTSVRLVARPETPQARVRGRTPTRRSVATSAGPLASALFTRGPFDDPFEAK